MEATMPEPEASKEYFVVHARGFPASVYDAQSLPAAKRFMKRLRRWARRHYRIMCYDPAKA